jgi:predicted dehydrogenase
LIRIAVVGCGAIADTFHLPGLRTLAGGVDLTLVDPSTERAEALARSHGAARTARSHHEVIGSVDGAVIASPAATHVPIGLDLLNAGVPILSEKPLGTTAAEVATLVAASERTGVPVAVNQTRRFIPACAEIHRLVRAGELGEIRSVEVAEGDRFGWPAATPAMFGLRSGAKGVVLDIGAHVLDLLAWWLGPGLAVEDYVDDSLGGSEASATIRLAAGQTRVLVRLSWLAKQRNRVRIEGSAATLEWGVYDLDVLTLHRGTRRTTVRLPGGPAQYSDLAPLVLGDFAAVVTEKSRPRVAGADVLPAMELIEACYARRRRYDMPWHPLAGGLAHGG